MYIYKEYIKKIVLFFLMGNCISIAHSQFIETNDPSPISSNYILTTKNERTQPLSTKGKLNTVSQNDIAYDSLSLLTLEQKESQKLDGYLPTSVNEWINKTIIRLSLNSFNQNSKKIFYQSFPSKSNHGVLIDSRFLLTTSSKKIQSIQIGNKSYEFTEDNLIYGPFRLLRFKYPVISFSPIKRQYIRVKRDHSVIQGVPSNRFKLLKGGVNMGPYLPLNTNKLPPRKRAQAKIKDFQILKRLGFKHIRLTISPATLWNEKKDIINQNDIDFFIEFIKEAHKNGLAIIVDMHGQPDYNVKFRNNPERQRKFLSFYKRFIQKIVPHFGPEKTFFETLNEPILEYKHGWWEFQKKIINVIRQYAPKHTIIANAAHYSSVDQIAKLKPYQDKNIVYGFHFYDPEVFTHQGMGWWTKFKGLPYPNVPEKDIPKEEKTYFYFDRNKNKHDLRIIKDPHQKINQVLARNKNEGAEDYIIRNINAYKKQKWTKSTILNRLREVDKWAKKNGNLRVIATEFGVFRWIDNEGTTLQRDHYRNRWRWLYDTSKSMNQFGFGWTAWSYGYGWGFIDNPESHRWVHEQTVTAYQIP